MDKEKRISLTRIYPQMKCLRCNNMVLDRTDDLGGCIVNMTPENCGRAFNPKNGGEADPIIEPPLKPRPKDGVELEIPKTEEKVNA